MRLGFIVILLAGIGIAGLSGYLVVQQINALENQVAVARSEAAKVVPTKEVYIATKEIPYGTPITIDLVKKFTWPAQVLPEGYFENEEDLFGSDSSEQRIAVRAMQENDLILASKVTGKGEDAGIVSRLGVGLRAFVLKVDVASGAFLRPGDLVDIYWTGSDRGQLTTRLILDGVELIAINQSTNTVSRVGQSVEPRNVTLAVDPRTVARLVQAQSTGNILVSLRGLGDTQAVGNLSVNQNDFLGIEEAVQEVVEQEQKCFLTERRGTEILQREIPCSE